MARVERRFLAGFTVALFVVGVAAIPFENQDQANKISKSIASAIVILLVAQVVVQVGHDALKLFSSDGYPDWQVAQELDAMGVKPGDRVSYMGEALTDHVWAYLGRFSIAAEISQEDVSTFWAASQDQKQEAITWLAKSGAKVIVTRHVPDSALPAVWKKVGHTDYYIFKSAKMKETMFNTP